MSLNDIPELSFGIDHAGRLRAKTTGLPASLRCRAIPASDALPRHFLGRRLFLSAIDKSHIMLEVADQTRPYVVHAVNVADGSVVVSLRAAGDVHKRAERPDSRSPEPTPAAASDGAVLKKPASASKVRPTQHARVQVRDWTEFAQRFAPQDLDRILSSIRLHGARLCSSPAELAALTWLYQGALREGMRTLCAPVDIDRLLALFWAVWGIVNRDLKDSAGRIVAVGAHRRAFDLYRGLAVQGGGYLTDVLPLSHPMGEGWYAEADRPEASSDVLAVSSTTQLSSMPGADSRAVVVVEQALSNQSQLLALSGWLTRNRVRRRMTLTANPFGLAASGTGEEAVTLIPSPELLAQRTFRLVVMQRSSLDDHVEQAWRLLLSIRRPTLISFRRSAIRFLQFLLRLPVPLDLYEKRAGERPFTVGIKDRLLMLASVQDEEDRQAAEATLRLLVEVVEQLRGANPKWDYLVSRRSIRTIGVAGSLTQAIMQREFPRAEVLLLKDLRAGGDVEILAGGPILPAEGGSLLACRNTTILCHASEATKVDRGLRELSSQLATAVDPAFASRGLSHLLGLAVEFGYHPSVTPWATTVEQASPGEVDRSGEARMTRWFAAGWPADRERPVTQMEPTGPCPPFDEHDEDALNEDALLNAPLESPQDDDAARAPTVHPSGRPGNGKRPATVVRMQDGSCVLLAIDEPANVLDSNGRIQPKQARAVEPGDKVVVIDGDARRHLYDVLRERTRNIPEFQGHWANVDLWRNVLADGAQRQRQSPADTLIALQRLGSRRETSETVENWLNGRVIGPIDTEDIRRVARLYGSDELLQRFPAVVQSIERLRGIHTRVTAHLRAIVAGGELDQRDRVVDATIGLHFADLATSIQVLIAASVDPDDVLVSVDMIGRVWPSP